MWVGLIRGKKRATGFDGGVRGLNRDLRGREVAPDENVQVRNLGERRVHEIHSGDRTLWST